MTWEDPSFAHPNGETNLAAQKRGVAVVHNIVSEHPEGRVVLATHGNLLALVLNHFEHTIDFTFWQSLTMPDIYRLDIPLDGLSLIERAWSDVR